MEVTESNSTKSYQDSWGCMGLYFSFSTASKARGVALNIFGFIFTVVVAMVAVQFSYLAWNGFMSVVHPTTYVNKICCGLIVWVADSLIPRFFWVIMLAMYLVSMIHG